MVEFYIFYFKNFEEFREKQENLSGNRGNFSKILVKFFAFKYTVIPKEILKSFLRMFWGRFEEVWNIKVNLMSVSSYNFMNILRKNLISKAHVTVLRRF